MFGNNGGKKPIINPIFGGQQPNQNPFGGVTINSYNQSGGITAHTVNLGPPKRDMNTPWADQLKDQIRRDLPRDKPITVMAVMGDGEAGEFAIQLQKYLAHEGFMMAEDGISQGMFSSPPINLGVEDKGDALTFIVGHFRP